MRELMNAIPDADVLLQLEPEELGAIVCELLQQRIRREPNFKLNMNSLALELNVSQFDGGPRYPENLVIRAQEAFVESWMWLERLGLLMPEDSTNGLNGFRRFSRHAKDFANQQDVLRFAKSKAIPKESLHPALRGSTWSAFIRGEYDTSVFEAMKAVEIAIRNACPGIDKKLYGVALAREAFACGGKQLGPLTDPTLLSGEQEGMMHLFGGALGFFKNALSHRNVNLNDPQQARDTVGLASLLLTMIDDAKQSRGLP